MKTARALLTDTEFNAVRGALLDYNPGMDPALASRIITEATAYVATMAEQGRPLVPSRVVDEGWHALILHTPAYDRLCSRHGAFVHHVPERPDSANDDPGALERTIAAMEQCGYRVDRGLWHGPSDNLIPVAGSGGQHSSEGPIVLIPKPKPKG
ncbi:hypothetical protein [Streptomyces sp. NPDC047097]|uniref:glycine-rich domain-containing protein n=1 Tax=Streptomyces sp. NPDC047097 TaxID=3155260 RepID=UPI0033D2F8F7